MSSIKVKTIETVLSGTEYVATSYPGPGVYYLPGTDQLVFTDGLAVATVFNAKQYLTDLEPWAELEESSAGLGTEQRTTVSEGTLLKALATVLRPDHLAAATSVRLGKTEED